MHIWVDADACPKVIKEILFRASQRTGLSLTLVANHPLPKPRSPYINAVQVEGGFDVADRYIRDRVQTGDLVITADIPLAAEVIERNALALNPRGELYTQDNIRQRLGVRNFLEEMRSAGQVTGGPAPMASKDRQAFANTLDRLLASRKN